MTDKRAMAEKKIKAFNESMIDECGFDGVMVVAMHEDSELSFGTVTVGQHVSAGSDRMLLAMLRDGAAETIGAIMTDKRDSADGLLN